MAKRPNKNTKNSNGLTQGEWLAEVGPVPIMEMTRLAKAWLNDESPADWRRYYANLAAAKPGVRVRVGKLDAATWAQGTPQYLEGATGAVERVRPGNSYEDAAVLVAFDAPVPMGGTRSDATGHWFSPAELVIL